MSRKLSSRLTGPGCAALAGQLSAASTPFAGPLIHEAQSIPTMGQVFSFHGFRLGSLERVENRITRLKVREL